MKYKEIVFLQGEEAYEPLNIIDEEGEGEAILNYLLQWNYGEAEEKETHTRPWGTDDTLIKHGNYVISYNDRLNYIGLIEITELK